MWANNNKKRFLHVQSMCYSDGVKDTSHKTKAKDSTRNARAKAKDSTLKARPRAGTSKLSSGILEDEDLLLQCCI